MTREKVYLAALAAVAIIVTMGVWSRYRDCEQQGGVGLRTVWGAWRCYNKSSLREVTEAVP